MTDRRAFATEIEVSPDGRFAGVIETDGSRIRITGAVKSQGSRVWIEITSDLVERQLRASAQRPDIGPDPKRKTYVPRAV